MMSDNIEYNNGTKRDKTFDIVRGIAIILIVLGHISQIFRDTFGLFNVGIFFICSGYFFKDKYLENFAGFKKFMKSKIKHLYFPFIIWNCILVLLHNLFLNVNIITSNPDLLNYTSFSPQKIYNIYDLKDILLNITRVLLFIDVEKAGVTSWFLKTLFFISFIVYIVLFMFKKICPKKSEFIIAPIFILFSIIGFIMQKYNINFYRIGTMMSCTILYYSGYKFNVIKNPVIKQKILFFALLILVTLCITCSGSISLYVNKYPNIFLLLLSSFLGFLVIYYISEFIKKAPHINKILSYIGQHSLSILLFHFLAFKIVNYMQTKIYNMPEYYLASSPVLINDGYWQLIYAIVGVAVPLFIVYLWSYLSGFFGKKNKTKSV